MLNMFLYALVIFTKIQATVIKAVDEERIDMKRTCLEHNVSFLSIPAIRQARSTFVLLLLLILSDLNILQFCVRSPFYTGIMADFMEVAKEMIVLLLSVIFYWLQAIAYSILPASVRGKTVAGETILITGAGNAHNC